MKSDRILVTGALGCIGAWTVKLLEAEGARVWTYDLPASMHRVKLIMNPASISRVNWVQGDILDFEKFEGTVIDNKITQIIHLAALQLPFVRSDPIQGAKVNVVGTGIVLETYNRNKAQVNSLVYASSAGVYGPAKNYPPGPLTHDAPHFPGSLYGAFKHCNEEQARIYWQDYQLRSIGLRPYVIYGPGRDQGITSTPSKAMVAATAGRSYQISYGGTAVFQYAKDAARAFIQAARANYSGATTYNIGGTNADMQTIVDAITKAVPLSRGQITFNRTPLNIADAVDDSTLEAAIGKLHWIPLDDGVSESIHIFRNAIENNLIDVDMILL